MMLEGRKDITDKLEAYDVLNEVVDDLQGLYEIALAVEAGASVPEHSVGLMGDIAYLSADSIKRAVEVLCIEGDAK